MEQKKMKTNKKDTVILCSLVISTLLFLGLTGFFAMYGWNNSIGWGKEAALLDACLLSIAPLTLSTCSIIVLSAKIREMKKRSPLDAKEKLKQKLQSMDLSKLTRKTIELNGYKITIRKIAQNTKTNKR